jgi:hypothetical protein
MAVFEIEQYEVFAQKHRVKAKNEAEAIKWLLEGHAQPVDNGLDCIEVCEDLGLPVDEYPLLAEELLALGVTVGDSVIPSIRSIEQVE